MRYASRYNTDMIIKCPECAAHVSDQAKFCPHCGHPIADHQRQGEGTTRIVRRSNSSGCILELIAIFLFFVGLFFCISVVGLPFGIVLIVLALILAAVGHAMAYHYECENCGTVYKSKSAQSCHGCGMKFRGGFVG